MKAFSADDCREFLETRTFRLRPSDYSDKYPKWPGAVGIEIEMLPVMTGNLSKNSSPKSARPNIKPGIVTLQGEEHSLAAWLRQLAGQRHWECVRDEKDPDNLLMIHMDEGDNLSFEPGGQLEFSSRPYPCLIEAAARTREVQAVIDGHLQRYGVELFQIGLNPWHSVDDIGLQMAKPRYRAMNQYFSAIGPYGSQMMRQTCTVQVNLDFGADETTLAKRYLASQLLAPVAAAMFSYSPIGEGKMLPVMSHRTKVWRHIDPSRTGVIPAADIEKIARTLTKKSCVDAYFDFVMQAGVVFVAAAGYQVPDKPQTWAQWLRTPIAGVSPTVSDLETHLSLLFPEVRPRGFLELRSMDCQSRVWEMVPAAFYAGILYDDKSLDRVIDLLLPFGAKLEEMLTTAVGGLADAHLARLAKAVAEVAMDGLGRHTCCFKGEGVEGVLRHYYSHFTCQGRVPANDLVDALRQSGGELTPDLLQKVEADWRRLL